MFAELLLLTTSHAVADRVLVMVVAAGPAEEAAEDAWSVVRSVDTVDSSPAATVGGGADPDGSSGEARGWEPEVNSEKRLDRAGGGLAVAVLAGGESEADRVRSMGFVKDEWDEESNGLGLWFEMAGGLAAE